MYRMKNWIIKLSPIFIFFLFTTIMLYPISIYPGSFVIGRPFDDVFEAIGYLGWYEHAIFDLKTSPLFQPEVYYPDGWQLIFAPIPPLFPTFVSPITAVLGSVVTYNFILFFSTIIAALGAYKFARLLGSGFWGGIFAGLLFSFYPNRQVYMAGFLNFLLASMWLPWMMIALLKGAKDVDRRTLWLALAGLFYSLSIASAYQYVYIGTLVLLAFAGLLYFPALKKDWKAWIKPIAALLAVILLVAAPILLVGYRAQLGANVTRAYSLLNLMHTSVSLERFFVPSARNPLFLEFASEAFPIRVLEGEDNIVTFGFVACGLTLIWLLFAKNRTWETKVVFAVTLICIVFMLGPFLMWQGQPIVLTSSIFRTLGRIVPIVGVDSGIQIPMPALLVYILAPPLRTFHHFGRIGMVVALSLGGLSGLGLTLLLERVKAYKYLSEVLLLCIFLLFIVEINIQPLLHVTSIAGMQREVDDWLAGQNSQTLTLEYPLILTAKGQSLYFYLTHKQKMVHGYSPMVPATFTTVRPILEQWPDETAVSEIVDLGVNYVIVNVLEKNEEKFLNEKYPLIVAQDELEFVGRFELENGVENQTSYFFGLLDAYNYTAPITYVFNVNHE